MYAPLPLRFFTGTVSFSHWHPPPSLHALMLCVCVCACVQLCSAVRVGDCEYDLRVYSGQGDVGHACKLLYLLYFGDMCTFIMCMLKFLWNMKCEYA